MFRSALVCALVLTLGGIARAEGIARDTYSWRAGPMELGPRLTQLTLTDVDTEQDLPMGGIGGYFRYRFNRRFGMELGLDILGSDEMGDNEVTRVSMPMAASGMFYLFPESRFQMYVLAGLGVVANSVKFEALGEQIGFTMPMVQLGLGAQYRFDDFRLDLSLRSLAMSRSAENIDVDELDDAEAYEVDYSAYVGDRTLSGGMVTLGIHWGI